MKTVLFLTLFVLAGMAGCYDPLPTVSPTPTPTSTLTVVFDNQADVAVDPHFYRSGSALTADELFADIANRYQNFNGKTTLPAKTSVTVALVLNQAATLGSNKAAFGDLLTLTGGIAAEKPVLHSGTDFQTHQTVTFTFTVDESKKYHTTINMK